MSPLSAAAIGLSLLLCICPAGAEVYRWVDEKGQVHFSDRSASAAGAETVQLKVRASQWQKLDIQVIQQGSLQQQAPALDVERIRQDVNNVYRFYDQVMYFDFYRQVPVKIHLLADRAEYIRYVQGRYGVDATRSLGIYLAQPHEIVVYLHEDRMGGLESTYATIRHEASHAILHSLAELMPVWLNEGMSEQMETLSQDEGQLLITAHRHNRQYCLAACSSGMDVLTFVEIPGNEWQKSNHQNGLNQSMSGQLVYMLLASSYGRSLITRLLQDYKRGVNKRSYYLLDEHYIGGRNALRVHWQRWLQQDMTAPQAIRF